MTRLAEIAVRVESRPAEHSAANALPILHEIRHALARLRHNAEPTIIDLNAMPFGPGDEARLLEVLGQGEVSAVLDALGESRVRETAFPGVWLVEHHAPDGTRLAFHIEITRIPQLLQTPPEDLDDGLQRLDQHLSDTASLPG